MSAMDSVAAVVVTFLPDNLVFKRLETIRAQVGIIVIVDNGSTSETVSLLREWAARPAVALVCNEENRGLAVALNQGVRVAADEGYTWVITFDQDSTPASGMVKALLETSRQEPDPSTVAIVGAHTYDERNAVRPDWWLRSRRYGFERVGCDKSDLHGVTFVITSGALTRISAWESLGRFEEGLFIDYIDHDFCLKALRAGWKVRVSAKARLAHNLGSKREVTTIGRTFRPTFHTASRHYYMARNRIWMWRRYAIRFPHWWLFDVCFGLLNTARVFLAEDHRLSKVVAMLRGTLHGLIGRSGPA